MITSAVGKIGKDTVISPRKKDYVIRSRYTDLANSPLQSVIRNVFTEADKFYQLIDYPIRLLWRHAATKKKKYTGYAYFMSVNMKLGLANKQFITIPP